MARLTGKVALVTGAASGIGRACAERLAAEGAKVMLTDVQDAKGREVAAAIVKAGGVADYRRQDVTLEVEWTAAVAAVKTKFHRLDILVNNAGIGTGGAVTDITLEQWRRQQSINVEGVFLGVKHSLPLMRAGGGGSIINMSSVAGLSGAANMSSYCATKGAVRLFTKAVAMECAALQDGVRVNSVHPGIIDTPIWASIGETTPVASVLNPPGANRPDLDALTAVLTPLGKPGQSADIAAGVAYLASDDARYVTGSELIIDGGMMAR